MEDSEEESGMDDSEEESGIEIDDVAVAATCVGGIQDELLCDRILNTAKRMDDEDFGGERAELSVQTLCSCFPSKSRGSLFIVHNKLERSVTFIKNELGGIMHRFRWSDEREALSTIAKRISSMGKQKFQSIRTTNHGIQYHVLNSEQTDLRGDCGNDNGVVWLERTIDNVMLENRAWPSIVSQFDSRVKKYIYLRNSSACFAGLQCLHTNFTEAQMEVWNKVKGKKEDKPWLVFIPVTEDGMYLVVQKPGGYANETFTVYIPFGHMLALPGDTVHCGMFGYGSEGCNAARLQIVYYPSSQYLTSKTTVACVDQPDPNAAVVSDANKYVTDQVLASFSSSLDVSGVQMSDTNSGDDCDDASTLRCQIL